MNSWESMGDGNNLFSLDRAFQGCFYGAIGSKCNNRFHV